MANHCGTCKHWTLTSDSHGAMGDCDRIKHVDETTDIIGIPLAFIQPDANCLVKFVTGGDFGCVLWEAKDGE